MAIYVTGAPLHMTDHPLWKEVFSTLRPSYQPPTRKKIATTILDAEFEDMQAIVTSTVAEAENLNLQCDGWSNVRNEGILNFVITTPKPVFVDFINTKENRHTHNYLSGEIKKILEKHDVKKFFSIIGDNARNMQKAFEDVHNEYPHLIPLGCLCHTLHLLCGDIIKCTSVATFFAAVGNIVKTITKSQTLSAIFSRIKNENNCTTSLKHPCKTRWGSYLQSLQSLLKCKATLQAFAVSETATNILPRETRTSLLDEDIFWVRIQKMADLLTPIVKWISKLESDEPLIHKTYFAFSEIEDELKTVLPTSPVTKAEEQIILKEFRNRKTHALKAIHYAAALLDPERQGDLLSQEELEAVEFIDTVAGNMQLNDTVVMAEVAGYRTKSTGIWGKPFLWKSVERLSPIIWWKGMCGSSELSKVAVRILSCPTSSAATERSFSTFGFIHNKRRNRLTTERAGKITYIAHNWRKLNKDSSASDQSIRLSTVSTESTREKSADRSKNLPAEDFSDTDSDSTMSGRTHDSTDDEITNSEISDSDN